MKYLFLFLTLSPYFLCSQNIALNEIDEFTDNHIIKVDAKAGNKWKTSDSVTKGMFRAAFFSTKYVNSEDGQNIFITIDVTCGILLCTSELDGNVILKLYNGEKITLKQGSRLDCNQRLAIVYYFPSDFQEQLEVLSVLADNAIEKFRIYTVNGYIDFDIKEGKEEILSEHFKLILEEIKSTL